MRQFYLVVLILSVHATAFASGPPPYPLLPTVTVVDGDSNGVLNQLDIDAAISACGNVNGCNLYFPAGVYYDVSMEIGSSFSNGFAMYGDGRGETVLRSQIFTDDDWTETLIIGDGAPDGVIIQDMSFDGRKLDQDPSLLYELDGGEWVPINPTNTMSHQGIHSRALNGLPRADGIIQRVEVFNYVTRGIGVRNSPGWKVHDNVVHDIGCHVVDVPCGEAWEQYPDDLPTTPGRKLSGFGIQVLDGSDNVSVKRNRVSAASKIAIQVYGTPDCNVAANGTQIRENFVSGSSTGISLNGACGAIVADNVSSDNVATGGEAYNLGKGFSCTSSSGDDVIFKNNVSRGNQSAGYVVACTGGNLLFENNVAAFNCRGNTSIGEFDFSRYAGAPTNGTTLTIRQATNQTPSDCIAAMYIHRWDDVVVEDSTLEGGASHGLRIENGSGIDVRRTTITGKNDNQGVVLGNGLEETYVHPSVSQSGYTTPVVFYSGALNDGDDVAYCPLESPMPAGCDP